MSAHVLAVLVVVVYILYLIKSNYERLNSKEYHTIQGVDMTDFPRDASNPQQIYWVKTYALEVLGIDYSMSRCLKVIGKYEERFSDKS